MGVFVIYKPPLHTVTEVVSLTAFSQGCSDESSLGRWLLSCHTAYALSLVGLPAFSFPERPHWVVPTAGLLVCAA